MNTDIKIVIYGQIENDTKIGFTYPDSFDPSHSSAQDVWLRSITDLRDAVRPFNSKETFAYWKNELGNYYAIIIPAIRDEKNPFFEGGNRHGVLMLTVFTGKKIISSGQAIIDALRKLKESLMINGEVDNKELIEEIIKTIRISLSADYYTNEKSKSNMKAFRSFSTEQELALILGQPNQAAYDEYKRIFVVPKNAIPLQQISGYKEITSPIKKTYTLDGNLPNGVFVDKKYVRDGDAIAITYTKDSYLPQIESVIVDGISNNFVDYNGAEIMIKDAAQAGIKFKRGIKIHCSCDGKEITNFRVKYNNHFETYDTQKGYVFEEDNLDYDITIEASGYEKTSVVISENDILKGSKNVTLYPQEKPIRVSLNIDGERYSDTITIRSNSPLYYYLKDADKNKIPINKYKGTKYKDKSIQGGNRKSSSSESKRWWRYLKISLIFLVSIYMVYVLCCLLEIKTSPWPFNKEKVETPPEPIDDKEGDGKQEDENVEEQKDMDYLKEKDNWNKDELKSDKYKELCDYLHNGQIEEILNKEPWFEGDVNGFWLQIIQLLHNFQSDSELNQKASKEIKRLAQNYTNIDVRKILSSLQSLQSSDTSYDIFPQQDNELSPQVNNRATPNSDVRKSTQKSTQNEKQSSGKGSSSVESKPKTKSKKESGKNPVSGGSPKPGGRPGSHD